MPNHEVHRIPHPQRVRNPVRRDVGLGEMRTMTRPIYILIALAFCNSCSAGFTTKKVHDATGHLSALPAINVSEPDRFLNDLKLSPLWKVEKERDGSFIAKARSIGQDWPSDGEGRFLFEFMAQGEKNLPKD